MELRELEIFFKLVKSGQGPKSDLSYQLFRMIVNFGHRVSEAIETTFEDFRHLDNWNEFTIWRLKKGSGIQKDAPTAPVEQKIKLEPQEVKVLRSIVDARMMAVQPKILHERLFPISKRTAQSLFTWYAAKSGLLERKQRLSIHALRHTCGAILWEASRDLVFVKGRLGHSSLKACEPYTHVFSGEQSRYGSERRMIG
jgi:integrase/recombinase XerC/integrase/recombinase XerD